MDFVWWHGRNVMAIEVKHASQFRREHRKGIQAFRAQGKLQSYIVYLGEREMVVDGSAVLPLDELLRRLHAGEIIG